MLAPLPEHSAHCPPKRSCCSSCFQGSCLCCCCPCHCCCPSCCCCPCCCCCSRCCCWLRLCWSSQPEHSPRCSSQGSLWWSLCCCWTSCLCCWLCSLCWTCCSPNGAVVPVDEPAVAAARADHLAAHGY